jgi:hypothetical protein
MLAAYVVSPSGHAWIVLFLCDKGFQSERASRPCGGSLRRTPAAIEPMRSDPKAPSSSSPGPLACVYPECLLLLAPLDTVWDAGNSRFSRLQRAGGTVPVQTRYQRVNPSVLPSERLAQRSSTSIVGTFNHYSLSQLLNHSYSQHPLRPTHTRIRTTPEFSKAEKASLDRRISNLKQVRMGWPVDFNRASSYFTHPPHPLQAPPVVDPSELTLSRSSSDQRTTFLHLKSITVFGKVPLDCRTSDQHGSLDIDKTLPDVLNPNRRPLDRYQLLGLYFASRLVHTLPLKSLDVSAN